MNARLLLISCLLAGPALAQYKIVAPDGSITYADRPPPNEVGKVTSIGRRGTSAPTAAADAGFPIELRQTASRYPVTLYTGANCAPCDAGRQLLQQRGIPYTEKRVLIEDDAVALTQLSGGRTLPSLTIGVQPLRGFNAADWDSYLDAAGYPRESRLPRGWQPAPAVPLAPRAASAPAG